MAYKVTIDDQEVAVSRDDTGFKLYIDGDLRDKFQGDAHSPTWRTLVRGSILGKNGHKAAVEFQIRASGFNSVLHRFVFADREIMKWKNGKPVDQDRDQDRDASRAHASWWSL